MEKTSQYYEGRNPVEMAWDDYVHWSSDPQQHQRRLQLLDAASSGNIEKDVDYAEIFSNFPWSEYYGSEAWADVARANMKLKEIKAQGYDIDPDESSVWIDHIFDLTHNTGSLFSKAPDYIQDWLMVGLELKQHGTPFQLLPHVSPEVAHLMREYMRLTGGVTQYQDETVQQKKQLTEKIIDKFIQEPIFPQYLLNDIEEYGLEPIDFASSPLYPTVYLIWKFKNDNALWGWLSSFARNLQYREPGASDSLVKMAVTSFPPKIRQYVVAHVQRSLLMIGEAKVSEVIANLEMIAGKREHQRPDARTFVRTHGMLESAMTWIRALESINPAKSQKESMSQFFLKMAELEKSTFFDFYLLNFINPDELYPDQAKRAIFLKKYTISRIIDDMIGYIDDAMRMEARHILDADAMDYEYTDKYQERVQEADDKVRQEEEEEEERLRLEEEKEEREEEKERMQMQPDMPGQQVMQLGSRQNWLLKLARNWSDFIQEKNAKKDQHRRVVDEICKRNGHILFPWTCMNSTLCRKCGATVFLHHIHGTTDGPPVSGRAVYEECISHLDNPNGCTFGAAVEEYHHQDYNGTTVI